MKKSFAAVLILLFFCLPVAWASGPVNPNTASVEELSQLTNIGPAKAQAIVADREENGPFRSVQELTRVSGIGERTVEMNLDRIQLD
ncbi:Competence protein ComEA helix-hairpin-helix region [Thioalkalivibrio nitratireducens DSM 14787]|uniref:Competence protein ComEA helix-hairpin-helix region n=1 Tax=Thioalkalivibrio nitratireducens (strain DSM 14787 / UNIQEM 213 / ALEN2) TaxID=1255043 RepID=L0DWP4_THIND|nr:ComEA family DNA-binding protein [Thioalkalivibrio nitratireducens]AGA33463.1 Competence protein ComEA helix-hairpin-helix region [Thioalkalivibrio nitratireducens DSM 14787]